MTIHHRPGVDFSNRPSRARRRRRPLVAAPAIVRAQQVTRWRCQSMWSASRADLQGVSGFLRAPQGQHQRPPRDRAICGGRRDRRVRDPRCGGRGRAAGAFVLAGLLFWQGCRPRRHQRFRVRLSASASGGGVVPSPRRHADAARGLRQVQRLSRRRQLVGRGVDRLQEADHDDGRLQGRQVPLAARHDRGNPDQARRLDRRAARAARCSRRSTRAWSMPRIGRPFR